MANLAGALKDEICRLARKEIKAETGTTKQAVAQYRREIAELKRQVKKQEKKIAFLEDRERERLEEPEAAEVAEGARFSPRSVKAQRKREVPPSQGAACSPGGCSWHREAGGAEEAGVAHGRRVRERASPPRLGRHNGRS